MVRKIIENSMLVLDTKEKSECQSNRQTFNLQFKLISSFLIFLSLPLSLVLSNFSNHKEIQKKSATSKESEQILGGCNMGAITIREIEEIRRRIPKCEYIFVFSFPLLFEECNLSFLNFKGKSFFCEDRKRFCHGK